MRKYFSILLLFFISTVLFAQRNSTGYWQQAIDYKMTIDMDVSTNQFKGKQTITYTNNSPDTLSQVFFHLYFNAFQPNSMMDARSRSIEDPDGRVGERIKNLKPDEIGYHRVNSLKQDGKKIKAEVVGTVLEVELAQAILPGKSTVFDLDFEAQVPIQVRRSGRDNKEGIRYSMTQWYPKMAEYDFEGWHADPYIAREFHGVWGDFDVTINIDGSYVLGATGNLQNPEEVNWRLDQKDQKESTMKVEESKMSSWHFVAKNVMDFAWVADPDYKHTQAKTANGTTLNFYFQADIENSYWDTLPEFAVKAFEILNENFGVYPYDQYSVAQGGDGGMEYPQITLITGKRSLKSLIGVTVHEAVHSWYQHLLATNEAQHPWMDEGFTTYASEFVMSRLFDDYTPFKGSYRGYNYLVKSGKQEPLTTHADHYNTNRAYSTASYSMGMIFLHQLSYIIGQEDFMIGMRRYFNEWKYKHPTPNDFIRIMEKVSGMELNWYLEQWTETLNTIDYAISDIDQEGDQTVILLERKGSMPMPLDVEVILKSGKKLIYNIPLTIMRGEKQAEKGIENFITLEDWPWVFPFYEMKIDVKQSETKSVKIDPSERMADINSENNTFVEDLRVIYRKE